MLCHLEYFEEDVVEMRRNVDTLDQVTLGGGVQG